MGKLFFARSFHYLLFLFVTLFFNVTYVLAQGETEAEYMEDLSHMRTIVLLLIAFAFVIMFGLIYVVKSHRELKHQYTIIDKQKNEIATKNNELAFINDSLEEMNVEKNNVLSVVAHDLKTPLGNIQGLIELVYLNRDNLTEDQTKYLDLIKKVVVDGIGMVNNMLDVHKIEAELKEVTFVKTNVFQVVDKVVKLHEPFADTRKVDVKVNHSNADLEINTDAQYLRQILSNLVSNAIKYTKEGSKVDVIIEEKDNTVEVLIGDEGSGISDDHMKRLFAGYKVSGSDETDGKASSGFGLLIARRLIDKLQGKITVTNKPDKGGAIFTVELLK